MRYRRCTCQDSLACHELSLSWNHRLGIWLIHWTSLMPQRFKPVGWDCPPSVMGKTTAPAEGPPRPFTVTYHQPKWQKTSKLRGLMAELAVPKGTCWSTLDFVLSSQLMDIQGNLWPPRMHFHENRVPSRPSQDLHCTKKSASRSLRGPPGSPGVGGRIWRKRLLTGCSLEEQEGWSTHSGRSKDGHGGETRSSGIGGGQARAPVFPRDQLGPRKGHWAGWSPRTSPRKAEGHGGVGVGLLTPQCGNARV